MMLASQTELNGKIRKKSQVKLRMTDIVPTIRSYS